MSLELTGDAINEFYDVIHSIDNSSDAISESLGAIASYLEDINNNLCNSNPKED